MKKIIPFAFFLISVFYLQAQLIETNPEVPITNLPVVVYFNAAEGSAGLAGYTDDVYAHAGVITDQSSSGSDWKYVKSGWGENTEATKLERIEGDLYKLEIGPSIREYYGVPGSEEILQLALVFRSEEEVDGNWLTGKTEEGGDIFIDVYESGLNVAFIQPAIRPLLVLEDEIITVEVVAFEADSLALYLDSELLSKTGDSIILEMITAEGSGEHWIHAYASNATETVVDSFYYSIRPEVEVEALPNGVRDGINYMDDNTVILTLVAPGKEFIYVLGDFNDWQVVTESFMKMTPDSTRFWLEISDLEAGKEYIYQYFVDGAFKVSDPYSDKLSDPWDDHHIPESSYPGLIDYPHDKTTGIASVLQTAQSPYQWQTTSFDAPPAEELIAYELLVRDFTTSSTYAALIDTIGYLKNLGVNAIELMPVNEFEGNLSWGYNPSHYFAPDKYYGPKDKLKEFVDVCHENGMAVIIDMVLNHAYGRNPWVLLYFDGTNPTSDNPWFNVHSNFTNPDAQWGYDFDHESLYTQQVVDSINAYWMGEYMVDGFRFDFTKGFGNNIKGDDDPWGSKYDADRIRLLKRMADEIWTRNPEALIILEHLSENSEEKELANYGMMMWGNINHNYAEAAMGYPSDLSWIDYKNRGWDSPQLVGYMESHDEERLMFKNVTWGNASGDYTTKDTTIALQRMALDAIFFLTIPGPKMIWQFGELGYDYSIDYNGRVGPKPVRWDYYSDWRRKYLYDVYSSLLNLRKEHNVFNTDDYTLNVSGFQKQIILKDESMDVFIVGNFDVDEASIQANFTHTGTWYDYFTGESIEVSSTSENMLLQPGEYHLYTDVQLTTPEIGTGIYDEAGLEQESFLVYPNPSNGNLSLVLNMPRDEKVTISVCDLQGREIYRVSERKLQQGVHTLPISLNTPAGIYVVNTIAGSTTQSQKIVLY